MKKSEGDCVRCKGDDNKVEQMRLNKTRRRDSDQGTMARCDLVTAEEGGQG